MIFSLYCYSNWEAFMESLDILFLRFFKLRANL